MFLFFVSGDGLTMLKRFMNSLVFLMYFKQTDRNKRVQNSKASFKVRTKYMDFRKRKITILMHFSSSIAIPAMILSEIV